MKFDAAAAYCMIAALAIFPTAEAGKPRLLHPKSKKSKREKGTKKGSKKSSNSPSSFPSESPSKAPSAFPSLSPSMAPSQPMTPFTDTGGTFSLQDAVNGFIMDGEEWAGGASYGEEMNDWDVSQVTDFNGLFAEQTSFNGDISR